MPANIHFVTETIQPATLIDGQVVFENNVYLLFGLDLDNVHFDILLPVEENMELYIFNKVMFLIKFFLKIVYIVAEYWYSLKFSIVM